MSTPADWPSIDLNNKLAVITGANAGIGFFAAKALAGRGAKVVLACRDVGKGEQAQKRIEAGATVEKLDLASLQSVRDFAAGRLADGRPIDLLVNNAGIMMPSKRRTTADGFELTFGTNHLGHFALTGLLLPLVLKAESARVVTLASIAHKGASIDFDDLQAENRYSPWKAYGQSKLANLLFGFELDRRLRAAGKPARSIVVHPGISTTELFSKGPGARLGPFAKVIDVFIGLIGQSSAAGALPTIYAATAKDAEGGTYIGPDGWKEYRGNPTVVKAEPQAHDEVAAKRLWDVSQQLTGVDYAL